MMYSHSAQNAAATWKDIKVLNQILSQVVVLASFLQVNKRLYSGEDMGASDARNWWYCF